MKKLFFTLLTLTLLQWTCSLTAQIVTTITPKVRLFPSSGLSYMDDPAKYFTIQMVNTSGTNMDVFFTIELVCDFSVSGENYYLKTKKEYQPSSPLNIGMSPVFLNRTHFDQMIGHLNPSAYETNIDRDRLIRDMMSLPEGQYRFCMTPYVWTGRNDAEPVKAGETACYSFQVCYTGSAPEITSPVNGLSAGNLNNSNPLNNILRKNRKIRGVIPINDKMSSDIRESSQYAVLPLQRNLNFVWTGVVSNCLSVNDFDYIFKIVEVYSNQNVQDAIKLNPTLATVNNKSKTYYLHDTLANRHFRLIPGHIYAVQVQAVLKKNLMTEISLGNDGFSQVITFVWGNVPVANTQETTETTNTTTNENSVLASIRNPYFVSPGKDNPSIEQLKGKFPGEAALVPADNNAPLITDGTDSYYRLPVSDDFQMKWMPVRGDSIFKVNYFVELYEYVGGDIKNSLAKKPLKTKELVHDSPYDFSPQNTTLVSLAASEWAAELQEGFKYLLHLKAESFYSYNEEKIISKKIFIHDRISPFDSATNRFTFGTTEHFSDIVFQWGVDSSALDQIYPPQFTYPVDLSGKDWNDTEWNDLPDVAKHDDFKFTWKSATGSDYDDVVYYKLLVSKLPKGKKPQQVKDTLYYKDLITTTSYIDSVLFDSLKIDQQYVATVTAYLGGSDSSKYSLLNGGRSLYATFKLVKPREYNADLNNKIKCSPKALEKLSKDIITPNANELISAGKKLMMGDFPLVIQKITKTDTAKKTYSGDGYVIWNPLGVDVRLKVKFDSIQINKDYQIINGTAVSAATDSSTYLPALMNDLNIEEWTSDDINRVSAQLGENEQIKGYYDKFMKYGEKYGKKYGGLLGPLAGSNAATEVLTFPLCVNDKDITGSENVIFSINNMFFSPVTALMNIWAIFAAQDDNYYVPFLANNICMDQRRLLGKAEQHIDLIMARNYEKKLNDGYVMRFKSPTNFQNPNDGTYISVDTGKLASITAEIEVDFDNNDFLGIDKDGTPRKGNVVKAKMLAKFTSWSDWVVKVNMDPFAVAGCDRFTFVPTGKGIYFDHSSKETPKDVSLTYEYVFGTPPPPQMKEDDKKKLSKATKEWQGFYWDELSVFLSDEISNTFTDQEKPKDSTVVYRYGINNTVVDSVHYSYPGSRINFGAKGLIIDKHGFTTDLYARDILKASTTDGGGWAFSLDTVSVRFVKNKYKEALIKGGFGIPLFKGGFKYECSVGADSLMFGVRAAKNSLTLDLWMAKVDFDNKSSYFKIQKIYKESGTRIDLNMNGKINIDFKKLGVPINFAAVKFEHMGMRNYNLSGNKANKNIASADKFEFDIGSWSFTSPQKTLGGMPSDDSGEQQIMDETAVEVSFAGFTFSLTDFEPIIGVDNKDIKKLKLGFSVVGQMKFATEGTDMGAKTGFSVWGFVNTADRFKVSDVQAKLNSIELNDIDFEVFKLSGKLDFKKPTASQPNINGFGGKISVSFMNSVTLTMDAGFGTSGSGSNEYTWWYFNGACKFPGGIPLGAVSINGFSGGFAYNMKSKYSLTDSRYSAVNLLAQADKNTNPDNFSSSGMEFEPAKNNWVANGGISLVLTGQEKTMNADGLISLRIANKHFSGIFIDANAYVLTNFSATKTPGDGSNNSNPLIRATAIIGYETTNIYDYFRLSLAVKAKISLADLLAGTSTNSLGSKLGAVHDGTSLTTSSNVTSKLDALSSNNSELTTHTAADRTTAANNSGKTGSSVSFNTEVYVPIDFELKHYKKKEGKHKAGSTDWYFAIGKPEYDKRVQLKSKLNVAILSTSVEFTFYMQTGNAFAYKMPPLSKNLQDFFGISKSGKKLDTDKDEIKEKRKISNTDWLTIDKGGGFCMGSTFHASIDFNFFLYLSGAVDLGFDVALLNVGGLGCGTYSQIGKNNFYALGRVYAALQTDVGLKINLGFWKGKVSLFKAGVGALLQGGGPNPSYAYGMLRFKINMLNGLLKFSTSCDFKVGNVCTPGAGDPLANVNLFQNVTPGFATENIANSSNNAQSPLQLGTIVSNMPWEKEVFLADESGTNARKFIFVLVENNSHYYTKKPGTTSYTKAKNAEGLRFTPSNSDNNVYMFETDEGGFVENCGNKLVLQARAFEWRQKVPQKNLKSVNNTSKKDVTYYVSGEKKGTVKKSAPTDKEYGWFDPTFYDDNSKKLVVKPYQKDTTLYFKTKALGNQLTDQVVFSWPYNGDRQFPGKEYIHSSESNPTPYCNLYLFKRRDELFNKTTLSNNGKELKIFLLMVGEEDNEISECSYTYYPTATVPYVQVALPKKEYGHNVGPRKLRFLLVEKNKYKSAMDAANSAMAITQKKAEYQSRISNSTYTQAQNAHSSNNKSSTINIKNQQLDEIYENKKSFGKDSVTYYRTKMKDNYKICSSVGEQVYEWIWFVEGNYSTYEELIRRRFSNYGRTDLDRFGKELNNAKVYDNGSRLTIVNYDAWVLRYTSWIFMPYDPSDRTKYKTTCELPPVAYLVLSASGSDNPLVNMHSAYYKNFLNMFYDFKKTELLTVRYSDKNGDGHYKYNSKGKTTVSDYSLRSELSSRLKNGFIPNYTTEFKNIDLRIKGGTAYEQCTANGFTPSSIYVDAPRIMKVTANGQREPMDEKYFKSTYASRYSIMESENIGVLGIQDYATLTMSDDIRMIHSFMQQNQQHAQAFNKRGWGVKTNYFNDFYSNKYKYARFSYKNFPYDMPEIYMVTHYMRALDNLRGGTNYNTIDGGYVKLYDKENEYIANWNLKLSDAYWSQYWWSATGQCLNYGRHGFDRDFYWKKSSTKYYNVFKNQADGGKQTTSSPQSEVFGAWYTYDRYKDFGKTFNNYLDVYYLTSQAPDFTNCLMNIAAALKKGEVQSTMVFFPNASIKSSNGYYKVTFANVNKLFNDIVSSRYLKMMGDDSSTGFNY